jgi:hypothetical protein
MVLLPGMKRYLPSYMALSPCEGKRLLINNYQKKLATVKRGD